MSFIACLENFGLKNFAKYKGHWSVEVVRAFYTNLEYKVRERKIYSELRGKKIEMDKQIFAEILSLPPPKPTDFFFTNHHNSLSTSFYGKPKFTKQLLWSLILLDKKLQ